MNADIVLNCKSSHRYSKTLQAQQPFVYPKILKLFSLCRQWHRASFPVYFLEIGNSRYAGYKHNVDETLLLKNTCVIPFPCLVLSNTMNPTWSQHTQGYEYICFELCNAMLDAWMHTAACFHTFAVKHAAQGKNMLIGSPECVKWFSLQINWK